MICFPEPHSRAGHLDFCLDNRGPSLLLRSLCVHQLLVLQDLSIIYTVEHILNFENQGRTLYTFIACKDSAVPKTCTKKSIKQIWTQGLDSRATVAGNHPNPVRKSLFESDKHTYVCYMYVCQTQKEIYVPG